MTVQTTAQPALLLRQIVLGMHASRTLYAVAQLGIADVLATGPMTSGELAAKTSTDARSIRRVMRALAALGIFDEVEPDRFALNPTSDLLRSGIPSSMRAGVMFLGGDLHWRLWSGLLDTIRTGEPAPERVLGKNLFEYYAEDRHEATLFDQAMAGFSAAQSPAVLAAYDFSRFRCLVDVAGGTGRLIADILAAHPALVGILFDLPHVVTGAPALLQASAVSDRCRIETGSFFDEIPSDGDAYLLKYIVHDWDDQRAIAILARCRAALGADGTLLILERVMPERAEPGKAVEAFLLDLEMLVVTPGGRERTEREFREILSAAGLALTRIVPTSSPMSIIEARRA